MYFFNVSGQNKEGTKPIKWFVCKYFKSILPCCEIFLLIFTLVLSVDFFFYYVGCRQLIKTQCSPKVCPKVRWAPRYMSFVLFEKKNVQKVPDPSLLIPITYFYVFTKYCCCQIIFFQEKICMHQSSSHEVSD